MHGGHFSDGTSRRASASVGRALTHPPPQVHRFRDTATSRVWDRVLGFAVWVWGLYYPRTAGGTLIFSGTVFQVLPARPGPSPRASEAAVPRS
jgi:hypothetical protein